MKLFKKILFFILCFLLIQFVASAVTGAVVGGIAARDAADAVHGAAMGATAAQAFFNRYGLLISLGALVISATIIFRSAGALISAGVSVASYFLLGSSVQFPKGLEPGSSTPTLQPLPANTSLVGRQMTVISSVIVDIPYGKGQVPAGTIVKVLSESGDMVKVRVWDGHTAVVPRANLK